MSAQGSDMSALFTCPSHLASTPDHRIMWQHALCEVGFETVNFSSVSLSNDAALSAYAQCLQTATVVDFGWSCLRVVPVIEGKPQYDQIKVHPIGGYGLTQLLLQQLGSRNIAVDPKNDIWTQSQFELNRRKTLTEILQNCCSFASSVIDEDFLYFLNGRPIDLKSEMTLISNLHFNQLEGDSEEDTVMPLPQLISSSINECSDTSKRKLWNNIVSSGGFSRLSSFIDKVQEELKSVADPIFDVRVLYPMHNLTGYENQVWTGGSIFSSSSIFPHFLVTKEEWFENGDSILNVKFK
ncbi:Actin family protein [Histomonas meleagridis]|uniref:Actin family protein n=1 Tax=Histomonas meleagridis TaxID=135588 RepID=UPI003559C74B|nr:Actin family protein [Histomonas meleagridis]KAH0799061.1 Actin family protein [Histomonas meleagridis]